MLPEKKGSKKYILTVSEAADFLHVSAQTLRNWETQGKLVPQRSKGGSRRYFFSQLKEFVAQNALYQYQPTTAKAPKLPKPIALVESVGLHTTNVISSSLSDLGVEDLSEAKDLILTGQDSSSRQRRTQNDKNEETEAAAVILSDSEGSYLTEDSSAEFTLRNPNVPQNDTVETGGKLKNFLHGGREYLGRVKEYQNAALSSYLKQSFRFSAVAGVVSVLIVVGFVFLFGGPEGRLSSLIGQVVPAQTPSAGSGQGAVDAVVAGASSVQEVLAESTQKLQLLFTVNIPARFKEAAMFDQGISVTEVNTSEGINTNDSDIELGSGDVTTTGTITAGEFIAPNLITGLTAGTGISVTAGASPTVTNSGVLSLGGQTGAVTLTAGTDISISGTTIADVSTLATVRARAGCSACIKDADVDNTLTLGPASNISGTAINSDFVAAAYGGTGLTTYTAGDLLYASAATTLAKLNIGTTDQALIVSGGVPTWATITGTHCPTCIITNPSATQTITPTAAGATGLSILQAASGTVDIFNVMNNSSTTKYLSITSSGNLAVGGNVGIGSTSPVSKLEVIGTSNITGAAQFGSTLGVTGAATFSSTASFASTLSLADGSVGTPALNFTNDTNTGLYRSGADILGFVTGGTERLTINAAGNVGVGIAAPYAKLQSVGTGTGTGVNFLTTDSTGAQKFAILDNGNVGIGTTNPGAKLSFGSTTGEKIRLYDDGTSGNAIGLGTATGEMRIFTYPSTKISFYDGGYAGTQIAEFTVGSGLGLISAGEIYRPSYNGTVKINNVLSVIGTGSSSNAGNVGIGSTSPNTTLDVAGTLHAIGATTLDSTLRVGGAATFGTTGVFGSTLSLADGSVGTPALNFTNDTNTGLYRSGTDILGLVTGGTERLTINAAGNVGIGTTAPAGLLHVAGQCVTGDTLLKRRRKRKNKNGEWEEYWEDVRIDQIQPGDEILTLDEKTGEFVPSKVKALADMGIKDIVKITTVSGKNIRTTSEHPYLVRENFPFVFVDETGIFEKDTTMMGVGTLKFSGDLSPINRELRDIFLTAVNELGGIEKIFEFKFNYVKPTNLHFYKQLLAVLKKYESQWEFNFAFEKRTKVTFWKQYLFLTFRTLRDIQGKFTVLADYLNQPGKTSKKIESAVASLPQVANILQIESQGSVFLQLVDILLGAKAFNLSGGRNIYRKEIAKEVEKLLKHKKGAGVSQAYAAPQTGIGLLRPISITNIPLNREDVKSGRWVKVKDISVGAEIATIDGWEQIKNIEHLPAEQVYDIEVENTHNFVGNNIVAHNTAIFGAGEGGTPTTTTLRGAAGAGTNIAGANFTFDASNGTGTGGSGALIFRTAPTGSTGATANTLAEIMRITPGGNVGIGTAAPGAKLEVNGGLLFTNSLTSGSLVAANPTSFTGNFLSFLVGGQNRFVVDQDGGITAGTGNWSISGSISASGAFIVANSGRILIRGAGGSNSILNNASGAGSGTLTIGQSGEALSLASDSVAISGTVTQTFTGTTTTGHTLTANSLTTGTGLSISSTSTAGGASGSSYLLNLARSGANANATHTAYGLYSSVTNTGTTSTNTAGYFSASGATTNYGIYSAAGINYFNGNVGIGTTAPAGTLQIGSGQVLLPDGSTSIPSLSFTNDTDTGFYRRGSGITAVMANGTSIAQISSTTLQFGTDIAAGVADTSINGRTMRAWFQGGGIFLTDSTAGTDGDYVQLALRAADAAGTKTSIRFLGDGNANLAAIQAITQTVGAAGHLAFQTAASGGSLVERMRIQHDGNVGIGTTAPSTKLDINAGSLSWSAGTAVTAGNYEIVRDADATNQLHFNVPTGATYEWSVNDSAHMSLSGAVGSANLTIGSGVDSSKLTVGGTASFTRDTLTLNTGITINASSGQLGFKGTTTADGSGLVQLLNGDSAQVLRITAKGALQLDQIALTSGTPVSHFSLTSAAHTGLTNAEATDINLNLARTVTFTGGTATTIATQRAALLQAPTYAATTTGLTITDASTLSITGAPIKGTNAALTNTYALKIAAGAVSTATNAYGLYVDAPTGATNNYAAVFATGNVGIGTTSPNTKFDVLGDNTYAASFMNGNVGIGTSTPSGVLEVNGVRTKADTATVWGVTAQTNFVTTGEGGYTGGMYIKNNTRITAGTSVNSAYGLYIDAGGWTGGGNITNPYGLYVKNPGNKGGNAAITAWFECTTNNLNNATNPQCSDYAEVYTHDGTTEAGDIVAINDSTTNEVTKSSSPYQNQILGVYSTDPGMLIGEGITVGGSAKLPEGKIPVALTGKVPVKVSMENGAIEKGDSLTSSSTPGVAMKATKAGQVVGKALEAFNTDGVGKILVYINVSWYDPDVYLTDTGDIAILPDGESGTAAGIDSNGEFKVQNSKFKVETKTGEVIKRMGVYSDAAIGNLKAGRIDVAELTIGGKDIAEVLGLATSHQPLATSSATLSASDSALLNQAASTSAGLIQQVEKLNEKLATQSGTIEQLASRLLFLEQNATSSALINGIPTLDSSSSAALLAVILGSFATPGSLSASDSGQARMTEIPLLSTNTATISGDLTVLGRTLTSELGVTGSISNGLLKINGLDSIDCHPELDSGSSCSGATINTLSGNLYLQQTGLGGIDILSGKIKIDTSGNMVSTASIATPKLKITTTDVASASLGTATLPAGETSIPIETTAVTSKSRIFVSPTSLTNKPLVVTGKTVGTGFTVRLDSAQANAVNFDWWIVDEDQ